MIDVEIATPNPTFFSPGPPVFGVDWGNPMPRALRCILNVDAFTMCSSKTGRDEQRALFLCPMELPGPSPTVVQ